MDVVLRCVGSDDLSAVGAQITTEGHRVLAAGETSPAWAGVVLDDPTVPESALVASLRALRRDAGCLGVLVLGRRRSVTALTTERVAVDHWLPWPEGEGYLGAALSTLARKAHEAAAAQRAAETEALVAALSHELKTPLHQLLGHLDLAVERAPALLRGRLEAAQAAGERLATSVKDALDVAQLDPAQARLDLVEFFLDELLDASLRDVAEAAERRGVTLLYACDTGTPPVWRGDTTWLRQLVTRLLSLAVDGADGGTVDLRVRGTPELEICVKASRGAAPWSLVGDGSANAGTPRSVAGIIVRKLSARLTHSLRVQSDEDGGYSVIAALRCAQAPARPVPAPLHACEGMQVLLVDPHAERRRRAAALLESLGLRAHPVSGCVAALEAMEASPHGFDVALLERVLPDGDGALLAAELEHRWGMHAPVLLGVGLAHDVAKVFPEVQATVHRPLFARPLGKALSKGMGDEIGRLRKLSSTIEVAPSNATALSLTGIDTRAHVLERWLVLAGFDVVSVSVIEDAVHTLDVQAFDLLVWDLDRVEGDPMAALRAAQSWRSLHGSKVPLLALTSQEDEATLARLAFAGADACVTGPLSAARIAAAARKLLPGLMPRELRSSRAAPQGLPSSEPPSGSAPRR